MFRPNYNDNIKFNYATQMVPVNKCHMNFNPSKIKPFQFDLVISNHIGDN